MLAKELKLRDVITCFDGPYSDATVQRIEPNGDVVVFRVYVATADFDYTGGVITYIGTETVTLHANAPVRLKERPKPIVKG